MRLKSIVPLNLVSLVFASFILTMCTDPDDVMQKPDDKDSSSLPGEGVYAVGAPIVARDGKVRFYVSVPEEASASSYFRDAFRPESSEVVFGNRRYPVITENGYSFVDVEQTASGVYNAVLVTEGTSLYTGDSNYADVILPYAQFYHKATETAGAMPMYASYSEDTGNVLIFRYSFAMVNLHIKGSVKIASVKIEATDKDLLLAGTGFFAPSEDRFTVMSGKNYVSLNTTAKGEFVVPDGNSGTDFPLFISSGSYPGGLDVTVCSSDHLMMKRHIDVTSLDADELKEYDFTWAPDSDLLYYEGFDNFVWGGDVMGGGSSYGCRPDASEVTPSSGTALTGYEPALTPVQYDCPGTGFIQPDDWAMVSGRNVADAHRMSASYVASRNIGDYRLLYRVAEYPGYIGVGTSNEAGGIFRPSVAGTIEENSDIKVSFDWSPAVSFADNLVMTVGRGGRVRSLTMDGVEAVPDASTGYEGIVYTYALPKDAAETPSSSADVKQWHHIEAYVENVNTATEITVSTAASDATGKHGFYLDNFEMRKAAAVTRGTLRVLYYNIQEGMWSDQHNNYDNFVNWVKRYNPDVCIWCEAETVYKDKQYTETIPKKDRYLPANWAALAQRYGHGNVAQSGDNDNYSQMVTSKYPITVLGQFVDTGISKQPISHGAGLFSVTVGGRTMNILSCHMWPQSYWRGTAEADRPASTAENGGDRYRQFEMQWLCDNVYNSAEYSSCKDWIMAGDMNSRSRVDNHYYKLADSDPLLWCQDALLNSTDLVDVIGTRYPGDFYSSVLTNQARVDYVYVSPSMYTLVANAQILIDDWCDTVQSPYVTVYRGQPSDHKPILVDFKY